MRVFVGACFLALITGCATDSLGNRVSDGAAVYHYKKTADSCEVMITSARNPTGVLTQVEGDSCNVSVETSIDPDKKAQLKTLDLANSIINRFTQ